MKWTEAHIKTQGPSLAFCFNDLNGDPAQLLFLAVGPSSDPNHPD